MPEEVSFGRWLKQRRKALDLTQEALGERVGCAGETIRRFEAERLRPSRQTAERLAEVLELPASEREPFVRAGRAVETVERPHGSDRPTAGAGAAPAATHKPLRAAQGALDEPTWAAAWDEGRTMPLEQMLAYALTMGA